ncbi:MAG: hypothetical protein ACK4N5_22660, partial [Myxococcales bacterium]
MRGPPMHLSPGTRAVVLVVALAGCGEPRVLEGLARISGESDHAGIALAVTGPLSAAAVTDASGAWEVEGLPPGLYVVTAVAPDTVEQRQSCTAELPREGAGRCDVPAFTAAGELRGRVAATDPAGL